MFLTTALLISRIISGSWGYTERPETGATGCTLRVIRQSHRQEILNNTPKKEGGDAHLLAHSGAYEAKARDAKHHWYKVGGRRMSTK